LADQMLINARQPEEIRIAVLSNGTLEEFFVERKGRNQVAGNIYLGRVTSVERGLQAAFVDLGCEKNGFLHVSDIISPEARDKDAEEESAEDNGSSRRERRRRDQPIEQTVARGHEVLVQITREGLGTKGASLTTYLSLPGRFVVLMPGIRRHGVSKKIEDEGRRKELKKLLNEVGPPADMGVIVRTAGLNATADDLRRDLSHLLELWARIRQRANETRAPGPVYSEGDLIIRALRDTLGGKIESVLVDDKDAFERARGFLHAVAPDNRTSVRLYEGKTPLFHEKGIEKKLDHLFDRHVNLPSGASIIVEQTEAMVTIDVNSGRFRRRLSNEDTILTVNMEAAREITRQLRLRDIGGLVMIDFIDMESAEHRQVVEDAVLVGLANDKARTRTMPISPLGVLEMTRQRVRPSLRGRLYSPCSHCSGSGVLRSLESTGLDFVRLLRAAVESVADAKSIKAHFSSDTALYMANKYRLLLGAFESETGLDVEIVVGDNLGAADFRLYTVSSTGKNRLFDGEPRN
jgi:ribonuclease E